MTVTALKPDLVICDSDFVNIYDLTVPFESNINGRHTYKTNKYAHFLSDISVVKPSVEAFEIGARPRQQKVYFIHTQIHP